MHKADHLMQRLRERASAAAARAAAAGPAHQRIIRESARDEQAIERLRIVYSSEQIERAIDEVEKSGRRIFASNVEKALRSAQYKQQ